MISITHNSSEFRLISDNYLDFIISFVNCKFIDSLRVVYNESALINFDNC